MFSINPITWINSAISYIAYLLRIAMFNIYNISFFILIILCMYYVIQAMCGSNKGKIGAISTAMIFAIIEMLKVIILG